MVQVNLLFLYLVHDHFGLNSDFRSGAQEESGSCPGSALAILVVFFFFGSGFCFCFGSGFCSVYASDKGLGLYFGSGLSADFGSGSVLV